MWHLIAHESEVSKPGDFVVIGNVALTNFDGKLIAWDGLCTHRGMRIYRGEWHGNNPKVQCAYHGRCQRADKVDAMPIEIIDGWVFVFEPHMMVAGVVVGPALDAVLPMKMPPMKLHSRLQIEYLCPWDVAIENALDFDHVGSVHKDTLNTLQLGRAALRLHSDGSSTEVFDSGLWGRLDQLGEALPKVFDDGFDYVHCFYAPDSCLSSTRGWTWSLQNYTPMMNGGTMFTHRLYVAEGCEALGDAVQEMNRKIFNEDAEIVRYVDRAVGPLDPSEKRIDHFRKSF